MECLLDEMHKCVKYNISDAICKVKLNSGSRNKSELSALPSSVCFALYVKATEIVHTHCKHTLMLENQKRDQ